MASWEDALRRMLQGQPAPPPREEAAPPPSLDWKAELLREANQGWAAAPAPNEPAFAPPNEPTPTGFDTRLVPPRLDLPRAFFTRHGYEPGKKPPTALAMRALVEEVYGASLPPAVRRMIADTPLFGALDTWVPGDERRNGALVRIVFERVGQHLGDALAFVPAPLGKIDAAKHYAGFFDPATQQIMLGRDLMHDHASRLVDVVVHEQMHRLQELLVQGATYRPRKLTPAQLSLGAWWYDEPTQNGRTAYAAYRHTLKEWHARDVAARVVAGLAPAFGWSLGGQ